MREKITRSYRIAKYVVYRQIILNPIDHVWTFIGAFIGIGLIGYIQSFRFGEHDNIFLIGSFGASAALVFGATKSPYAQPRSLLGGHLICSIIGVAIYKIIPNQLWLSSSLAVSLAIVAMQITNTMHPPGGATALIASIGSAKIKALGFYYIFSPVMSGSLILLVVALAVNNIPKNKNYPYRNSHLNINTILKCKQAIK